MVTGILRLVVAVVAAAVLVQVTVSLWPVRLENLFGYFTIQSNVIGVVVGIIGGIRLLRGRPVTQAWVVVRWCAATYLVVVGVVFWGLLAPLNATGGIPDPLANAVLHGITPAAALVDLLLARDRRPVPLRRLPLVLVYPLIWTAVVLIRGATDGWVPYPFLDPSQGYGVVLAWVLLVAGVFTGAAALLRLALRRT